jgi:ATP-dependent DNA ligase
MLAQPGTPFDSDDFLFEVKWDGARALAFIEEGSFRLLSRQGLDRRARYPELAGLAHGPAGTVLDGEIVVLQNGQPDFRRLQAREQTRTPLRIRLASQACPVTYVVFDLLYEAYRPLLAYSLTRRRQRLERLVERLAMPQVAVSAGIVGAGRALFQEVCRRGLEGMVAKRLSSRYQPGRRCEAWRKIKPRSGSMS